MKTRILQALLLMLLVLPSAAKAAGTTGKIVGTVIDKKTREPLIGASVVIDGTRQGARTDIRGRFTILNVLTGTYTLKATYVGYGAVALSGIKVIADLTAEADFELEESTKEVAEIKVISERPLIEKSATTTTRVVTSEQIQNLPTRGATAVASQGAGVVTSPGGGNLFIRGGRSNEVAVYVDGILQNNPVNRTTASNISNASLEEVVVLTSFDAEYGNANSGVINIATRSGSVEKYFGGLEVVTDAFMSRNRGANVSGLNGYGYNIFNFQAGGPLLPFNGLNRVASGYLAIERQDIAGRNAFQGMGILPNDSRQQWNGNTKLRFDLGSGVGLTVGGNFTTTRDLGATATDQIAAAVSQYATVIRLPQKAADGTDLVDPNNGTVVTRDSIGADGKRVLNIIDDSSVDNGQRVEDVNLQAYIKYTQTFGSKTILNLNFYTTRTDREVGDNIYFGNLSEYGAAIQRASILGIRQNDVFGLSTRPDEPTYQYTKRTTSFYELEGNLETQIGEHNIKTGGQFRYHIHRQYAIGISALNSSSFFTYIRKGGSLQDSLLITDVVSNPENFTDANLANNNVNNIGYTLTGATNDEGPDAARRPIIASLYAKDSFQLNDFTAQVGLRLDYFYSDQQGFVDVNNPYGQGIRGTLDEADFAQKKSELLLSPRIYFSFPVTDRTVFHAGFGRYTQAPNFERLYFSRNSLASGRNTTAQNPDIRSEKTSSYEVGFRQALSQSAFFDITTFYKETRDQLQLVLVPGNNEVIGYNQLQNADFGTNKGLEVTFGLRRTNYVQADITYTLSFANGTASNPTENSEAIRRGSITSENPLPPRSVLPLAQDQRHTGTVNLDLRTPLDDQSLSSYLRGWGANFLFRFGSGTPYSSINYNGRDPVKDGEGGSGTFTVGQKNSQTAPWWYQLDLRIDKNVSLFDNKLNVQLYALGINILGFENTFNVWRGTGTATEGGFRGTQAYQNQLDNFDNTYGAGTGAKYDSVYRTFERGINFNGGGQARQIRLGALINF